MLSQIRTVAILFIALTLLTGGVYPVVVTVFAQLVFPRQANGSIIEQGDHTIGSDLIGQSFTTPKYFWGRLSATAPMPYNAAASRGSNYGPLHPSLKNAAEERISVLRAGGVEEEKIPIDLVTASGSGLDPHISPAAAEIQVERVAKSRKVTEEAIKELVRQHTERRQLGVLGEPRVNVLRLNLALDEQQNKN